jgi:dihydrofolate synthase/folylpolyglutamate synthase
LALCRKGFAIEDEAILCGLAQAKQPARLEIISLQPLVILDGGHNPDGVDALAGMIERSGLPKMHAVMGMMKDKACEDMLRRLSDCFDVVYTVTPSNPRSMPAEELAALAKKYFDEAYPADSVAEAIEKAKQGIGKLKGMCVCGSLYLAGDARKILLSDAKN